MSVKTFDKEFMFEILDGDEGEIISNTIVENSRWSISHELIFKYEDVFYRTFYSVGATEMQDESPWEYDDDVECTEVVPVEKTIIVYEKRK